MSKSLKRVRAALEPLNLDIEIIETGTSTRTAQEAADVAGCHVDQIAKSIIFKSLETDQAVLFLTAGGNRVDQSKAEDVAGAALGKADAELIRKQTGFAIGGVAPIGHLNPIRAFFDPRLLEFDTIWAAAGTPHHIFPIAPKTLEDIAVATVADFTASA